jgi:hypothetical protein
MEPEEIERVIAYGLKRLGPGTITSAAALRRDLARTRGRGRLLSVALVPALWQGVARRWGAEVVEIVDRKIKELATTIARAKVPRARRSRERE